ncbi:hypothetical protein DFH08DRAFT_929229 [Mycena albidolilacea]|uniref:F-box domain-containing protein n=1 Tax=Mycena albidolilacea TaxID=1033008 RepID=A0AAD7F4T2_9AGAR|nr:hypothetical protein DFH08DRAFT_929229 [Mycena albidolilacea]
MDMNPTRFLSQTPGVTPTFDAQAKILLQVSEANLARIESEIKALERLRDQERGTIAALRTAIAPIRKLPTELLVEILLAVRDCFTKLAPRNIKPRIRNLHALSQVCVYWRRIVHTTPQLWTDELLMTPDKTPTVAYIACVKEWLERSAPMNIPVHLEISREGVDAGPLMDAMVTTAHRWNAAEFTLPSFSLLSRIPSDCLKSLERVSLQSTDDCLDTLVQCTGVVSATPHTRAWPASINLSQRHTTALGRLEDLSIWLGYGHTPDARSVAPLFMCLALPALKKLDLYDLDSWPSAEFAQFQLRSPKLESLQFSCVYMQPSDLLSILRHGPSLVELNMGNCVDFFDNSIISGLQYSTTHVSPLAPKLETLSLSYTDTDFDEDALDAMIQSRWWTDEQFLALPSPPKVSRWSYVEIERGPEDFIEDGTLDAISPRLEAKVDEYRSQGLNIFVFQLSSLLRVD